MLNQSDPRSSRRQGGHTPRADYPAGATLPPDFLEQPFGDKGLCKTSNWTQGRSTGVDDRRWALDDSDRLVRGNHGHSILVSPHISGLGRSARKEIA